MNALAAEWYVEGRPALLDKDPPQTWLIMGGRGSGKTRLGAEWVNCLAKGFLPYSAARTGPIALVGATIADVRDVMIEGPAGVKAVGRRTKPRFIASRRELVWANGLVAQIFSSEDPESLRGPQFAAAWCDEIGKWNNAIETWDMLQFGLRVGDFPRLIATTTPRPTPLIKRLRKDPYVIQTLLKTSENAQNLAPGFVETMTRMYGKSGLGRQELEGEYIEDKEDALWKREKIEKIQRVKPQNLNRIVIGVDPPATSRNGAASCGIVAAGLDEHGIGWVLADHTISGASPEIWARRAVALYHELQADRIVAEVNQGGEMVMAVMRQIDPSVAVKSVYATRGKHVRAEPVSALYTNDKVFHAARFPELEDEMCNFTVEGLSGGRSPDRLDALVWALTELMLRDQVEPRVRGLG